MKKKIVKKKIVKKRVKKPPLTISKCNFIGVKFDEAATEAIIMIADGLVQNAKALGSLALVLKASNVNIETMLKIDN